MTLSTKGRLLGLDRVCEVKTPRRKLTKLAAQGKADELAARLARLQLAGREEALGFLYVDGHVRVYHGKHKLAKGYVTQRRLAMPATTDYWVNDQEGSPILVVTAPANEGLSQMLLPVLDEVRQLLGSQRRVTVVFDRGGWSLKLFRTMVDKGFDFVTYRKGTVEPIPEAHFSPQRAWLDGGWREYRLHERSVFHPTARFWLRQVSHFNHAAHQTHIVTSRQDLPATPTSASSMP
ncbi:MAG: putative transposase [Thermodesulfobacteriota bacterium]